jgi:hypothetical protein
VLQEKTCGLEERLLAAEWLEADSQAATALRCQT